MRLSPVARNLATEVGHESLLAGAGTNPDGACRREVCYGPGWRVLGFG